MTNVLYTCQGNADIDDILDPDNPEQGCASRVFALPGGTSFKCRHHPESKMVQREDAAGNFLYTETLHAAPGKGERASMAGNPTTKDVNAKAEVPIKPNVIAGGKDVSPDGKVIWDVDNIPSDLGQLRQCYEDVFGEPADKRFREAKLEHMIKVELDRQATVEHEQRMAQKAALEEDVDVSDEEDQEEVSEEEEGTGEAGPDETYQV